MLGKSLRFIAIAVRTPCGSNFHAGFERMEEDPINPAHYKGDTIMVFIETFNLGFCLGNVVKYVARSPNKGATLDDLKKALWYLNREISNMEKVNGSSIQEHG